MLIRIFVLAVLLSAYSLGSNPTDREVLQALVNDIDGGRPREALANIEERIQQQGPTAQLLWVKGRALRSLGDANSSVKAYTESIKLNPNQVESYNGRAMALYMLGIQAEKAKQPEYTKAAFTRMLSDASQLSEGRQRSFLMSVASRKLGRKADNIRYLTETISYAENDPAKIDSDLANLYAERAAAFNALGTVSFAADDLIASHKFNPKLTTLREVLDALADAARFDDIVTIMDEQIASAPNDALLHIERFGMIGRSGDMKTAVEGLEGLKQKYTDDSTIKEIDSVIAILSKQQASSLNQAAADKVAQKLKEAQSLLDSEDYARALDKAIEVGRQDSDNPVASRIAGDAFMKMGKFEDAVYFYSISIRSGSKQTHRKRAAALNRCGLVANTVFDLEQAIALQPSKEIQIELAFACYQSGQYEKAVAACTAAQRLGAPSGEVNAWRALAYQKLGEHQKTLDDFAIAFQSDDNIGWRVVRANLFEKLGRYQEAKADFVRIRDMAKKKLESAPENSPEATKLANLVRQSNGDIGAVELFINLQQHMEAFVGADISKAKELTASFIPTLDVCKEVFDDEFAAVAAKAYSELFHSGEYVITTGAAKNTEVLVAGSRSDTIIKGMKHKFAGGWDRMSKHLRAGQLLLSVRFIEPGETLGMRFEGFVKVDNQWYLIPKPWRLLKDAE